MMTDHMIEVRRRESDPQEARDAQDRAETASDKMAPHLDHMVREAHRAEQETLMSRKFIHLRRMVEPLANAMDGVAACRRGCSHCCHIPVMLSQAEAQVIADELHITAAQPEKFSRVANLAYDGVPCPFLANNECSIYESRPFACRIHYSLSRDDFLCRLVPGESILVPFFNNVRYLVVMVHTLGPGQEDKLADIREFFPTGKS